MKKTFDVDVQTQRTVRVTVDEDTLRDGEDIEEVAEEIAIDEMGNPDAVQFEETEAVRVVAVH